MEVYNIRLKIKKLSVTATSPGTKDNKVHAYKRKELL